MRVDIRSPACTVSQRPPPSTNLLFRSFLYPPAPRHLLLSPRSRTKSSREGRAVKGITRTHAALKQWIVDESLPAVHFRSLLKGGIILAAIRPRHRANAFRGADRHRTAPGGLGTRHLRDRSDRKST